MNPFILSCLPLMPSEGSTPFVKVLTELLSNKWVTQYRAGTEMIPGGGCREGAGCLSGQENLK